MKVIDELWDVFLMPLMLVLNINIHILPFCYQLKTGLLNLRKKDILLSCNNVAARFCHKKMPSHFFCILSQFLQLTFDLILITLLY